MIQQELHAIQHEYGYLPAEQLRALAERIDVPLHRLHEVASCFPHYRLKPPPQVEFLVCRDMACHLRGAPESMKSLQGLADELGGDQVKISGVSCLGQCDAAPAAMLGHQVHRGKSISECRALLRDAVNGRSTSSGNPEPAIVDPRPTGWLIDPYEGREEYAAARKLAASMDGNALIEALKVSDLRGMGGAGSRPIKNGRTSARPGATGNTWS